MSPIWFAFLTGLTTGGISCLAVQGGLLASAVGNRGGSDATLGVPTETSGGRNWSLVGMFIVAKLASYTILGFLLGLLGSTLSLSPVVLGYTQIGAGLFMIATALRIADVHPIFRYFVIQPPRWAFRLLRTTSRSESLLAPALLGFLTVLLPCGVTQATMATAVASGNPWLGAGIMFAFILGTSPIFFLLGATVSELLQKKLFSYAAAGIVGIFALISINGGIGLTGSPYTFQNFVLAATTDPNTLGATRRMNAGVGVDGKQRATITVTRSGYDASVTTLKAGVPVQLTLQSVNAQGCARAFMMPSIGLSKILPVNGEEVVEFTPMKTGRLAFSCSMGMFTGQFTIVN